MKDILACMPKFEANHEKHIAVYGRGNERRLTGRHETASIDVFRYGVLGWVLGPCRVPRVFVGVLGM